MKRILSIDFTQHISSVLISSSGLSWHPIVEKIEDKSAWCTRYLRITSVSREKKNPRLFNLILEIAISRRKEVMLQHLGVARNLIPQSQREVRELLITLLSHRQPRKFIGAGILFRARINGSTASINPFLRPFARAPPFYRTEIYSSFRVITLRNDNMHRS